MKKIFFAVLTTLLISVTACQSENNSSSSQSENSSSSRQSVSKGVDYAFENRISDLMVAGEGEIVAILRDDLEGSRHQKLIVKMPSGRTVLIAHNIDLAPRVPNPKKGSRLKFYGEYEWSEKGGVVHWTHHDPVGKHDAGWLEYNGKKYQ